MGRFKYAANFLSAGLDLSKKKVDDVVGKSARLAKKTVKTGVPPKIATKSSPNVAEQTAVSIRQSTKGAAKKTIDATGTSVKYGLPAAAIGGAGYYASKKVRDEFTGWTNPQLSREEKINQNEKDRLANESTALGLAWDRLQLNKSLLDAYSGVGGNPMDFAGAFAPAMSDGGVSEKDDSSISPILLVAGAGVAGYAGYKYLKKRK